MIGRNGARAVPQSCHPVSTDMATRRRRDRGHRGDGREFPARPRRCRPHARRALAIAGRALKRAGTARVGRVFRHIERLERRGADPALPLPAWRIRIDPRLDLERGTGCGRRLRVHEPETQPVTRAQAHAGPVRPPRRRGSRAVSSAADRVAADQAAPGHAGPAETARCCHRPGRVADGSPGLRVVTVVGAAIRDWLGQFFAPLSQGRVIRSIWVCRAAPETRRAPRFASAHRGDRD